MSNPSIVTEGNAALFGLLDRTTGRSMRFVTHGDISPTHILRLGSLTKTLLAFIALKHRIPLNEPVEAHLKTLHHSHYPGSDEITFRHLLNHTSGVFSFTELPNATKLAPMFSPTVLVDLAWRDRSLMFVPGSARFYSNTNSEIVAMWLMQLTQECPRTLFEQEFRQHGLTTLTLDSGEDGDFPMNTNGYRDFNMPFSFPSASGRLLADAKDILIAMDIMASEKEIWEKMKLWTDAPLFPDPDNPAGGQKYGLFLQEFQFKGNTLAYGHDGHIGVSTLACVTPEHVLLIHATVDMCTEKWMAYVSSIMDEVLV